MHQSINKKKIYFYLLIFIFLSTSFNLKIINLFKDIKSINVIEINGLNEKERKLLNNELKIFIDKNIFLIEKEKILLILKKFNFLNDFNIQKVLPSKLIITAKKTNFLATTFINGEKYFIGSNGKFTSSIEIDHKKKLPVVFGKFSIKDFLELQDILLKQKIDLSKIEKYFFHQSKRWDLEKENGLIIMLPGKNISNSLKFYKQLKNNNKLDLVTIVDLRIPERIVLNYE